MLNIFVINYILLFAIHHSGFMFKKLGQVADSQITVMGQTHSKN